MAMSFLHVFLPIAGTAAIGGAIVFAIHHSHRARQRRIAVCADWAARHGFQYLPFDPSALGISVHPPLSTGYGRKALDVFRGTFRNSHLHCFQYRCRIGNDKRTTDFQVVAINLPAMRPLLDVSHEDSLSRMLERDIDFENQAFNDRFKITSPNTRFAYDVIHPRTMEWMLADPRAHVIRWRFEGSWLITFRLGPLELDELFYYADFLHQVLAQVPKHVWSER